MSSPRAELVVQEGKEEGLVFPLRPGKVVLVGREGNFRIDDPSLSRRHCEIDFAAGTYRLRDLNSRWGTFVNGTRVGEDPLPLAHGDLIRIGSHFVRIDIHAAPPPPAGEGATVALDPAALAKVTASLLREPEPVLELELEEEGDDIPWDTASRMPDPIHDETISSDLSADVAAIEAAPVAEAPVAGVAEAPLAGDGCGNCGQPAEDPAFGFCNSCREQYPLLGHSVANHDCIRVLGTGGMGIVYLAKHRFLGRLSAIKTLRGMASADPVLVQRLLREATAGGRISHPNIVAVHDTGEQDGLAWVVMEYVPGENLAEALKREKRFAVRRALWFMTQLADAMAAAFLLGYIHRDIKPENILLAEGDVVKVTDFGLAKNLTEGELGGLTRTGQVLGTMVYIAPEQIVSSKGSDQRADIYSLGATFFHLLAGRPPFDSREAVKLLMQIRREEPPRIETLVPDIPPAVAYIVHRCLKKDPAERYASPELLLADCLQATREIG